MTAARLTAICAVYLGALLVFGWGFATARYEVFPWRYLENIHEFVRGDLAENSSLAQKVMNDLGMFPERWARQYAPSDVTVFDEVALDGIRSRRDAPRQWISPSAPESYRLIVGAFDFKEALWGAVLLDPSGSIMHHWKMNAEIEELSDQPDALKGLYGVAFLPDGSAIFTMQERSGGLIKVDACSQIEWTKKGSFHHAISLTEDSTAFWTFGGRQQDLHPKLLLIDAKDGKTIKEIDMAAVEKANPETFIFDLQWREDVEHATHANDIDPLPEALADAYAGFSTGDLLISYRETNLIFVIDPETLKIKWWHVGAADGPHDPDWHKDGTISIFNNNRRADRRTAARVSTIVSIDPNANTHRTILDGGRYDFYSGVKGHHQFTDEGTVIVTSTTQGRVFEVDLTSGRKVFDFVNAYDWKSGRTLEVSEAMTIDREQAERWASQSCPTETARR